MSISDEEMHHRVRLSFCGYPGLSDGGAVDRFVEHALMKDPAWPVDYDGWQREPGHLYGWVFMSEKVSGTDALDAAVDVQEVLKERGFKLYATYFVFWRRLVRNRARDRTEWRFSRGGWILVFEKRACVLLRAQHGHVALSSGVPRES